MNDLIQKIQKGAKEHGDKMIFMALDYERGHQEVNYGKLWECVRAYAATMKEHGICHGKRAVILCDNSLDNIYMVYACVLLGVTFTILPVPIDEGKINRYYSVVQSCSPDAVLVPKHIYGMLGEQAKGLMVPDMKCIYDWVEHAPTESEPEIYDTKSDDIIYLQYSSGSTNEPKGVMISYENLMANLADYKRLVPADLPCRVSWVPFFHNIGLLAVIFKTIYDESYAYLIKTTDFIRNPLLWLRAITEFKADITVGPNSAYDLCTKIVDEEMAKQFDLTSVKVFGNGSEMVLSDTIDRFCHLFHVKPETFMFSYGLAETVCTATGGHEGYEIRKIDYDAYKKNRFVVLSGEDADNHINKTIVSNGRPLDTIKVVIADMKNPTQEVTDNRQIGEICLQGPAVAKGYLGDIDENANFHHRIDSYEGEFLRTGDMGVLYEGKLYVTGRIKELIIINGHNIYPSDVQHTIFKTVRELAGHAICVFSYSVEGKERVVIIIEVDANEKFDYESISGVINHAVTNAFEVSPYDIAFVQSGSLIRTDNGKLRIHKIRRAYKSDELKLLYSGRHIHDDSDAGETEESTDLIEQGVRSLFDKILHISGADIHTSFLELGGNSFDTLELIVELEQKFSVKFDAREILLNPSVCGIAEQIRSKVADHKLDLPQTNLYAECVLPDEIAVTEAYEKEPSECSVFFLTGSTGFLGAYLIASILKRSAVSNVKLYCHCRAKSQENGMERIKKNMQHYMCWEDAFEQHIYPVLGDLAKPHMGIEETLYQKLAGEVELVIHNGALLNFMFPYEYLRKTNVYGTQECLRFACGGRPKYFNYISSFSVYDNPSHFRKTAYEDDLLESADGYFLGYSQTKWVSEKLVGIAKERGLKACIFRPGDITGTKDTGIWEMGDLISRILVSAIQTGRMPGADIKFFLTPVDYVADAITHILANGDAYGKAFNLVNTNIAPAAEVKNIIEACGYPIEIIPYDIWQRELVASDTEKNALKILACLFDGDGGNEDSIIRRYSDNEAIFDTSNTDAFLKGSDITCPPVDKELISAYLRYFAEKGYIVRR
ncbi:MAG: thioester reductase domain-containing protein [Clostridium sp.]|nr:thioester reductase domain-containing protein [Clostridium sp.]MCM1460614.1 thioester reductase domain-containing protein [Bacteroides sp.]